MQVQGHEMEVDEAGIGEVEDEAGVGEVQDEAEVGEVEEDDNRDKEEQAMSSMYFNVKPYSSLIM